MTLLDALPAAWRADVTVAGPSHRDADGHYAPPGPPVTVAGCLVAPGASTAPGMTAQAISEAADDVATLYAPPGAPVRHRDVVTVPAGHALAGSWVVETSPAPWPLGLAVTMVRR